MRDQAVAHGDDVGRPVLMQARLAISVDSESDPGTPSESVGLAGERLHGDLAVDAGDPAQLLTDHRRLELTLRVEAGVLPVAAAAAAGTGIRARRPYPRTRRLGDLDRVVPAE